MASRSLVRLGALALLVGALVAPSTALAASGRSVDPASAVPAAVCVLGHSSACPIRIHFALGAYSAQAHSSLTGITSTRWFVVHLAKNQQVTIWVIGKTSVRSVSRSVSAIAQLLVPRSIPRLKRALMREGASWLSCCQLGQQRRVMESTSST